LEQIRDDLYWVTDDAYNTMFLVTDNAVIAVDAPPTQSHSRSNKQTGYTCNLHTHKAEVGTAHMEIGSQVSE
jgi:hypothetical protein